jgi:hypothetical protein
LGTGLGGYAGASGTYGSLMSNWQQQNQAEQEMWKNLGGGLAKMFNPQDKSSTAKPMGSYGGIPVAQQPWDTNNVNPNVFGDIKFG